MLICMYVLDMEDIEGTRPRTPLRTPAYMYVCVRYLYVCMSSMLICMSVFDSYMYVCVGYGGVERGVRDLVLYFSV